LLALLLIIIHYEECEETSVSFRFYVITIGCHIDFSCMRTLMFSVILAALLVSCIDNILLICLARFYINWHIRRHVSENWRWTTGIKSKFGNFTVRFRDSGL
jgi:hypothetical protein